MLVAEERQRLIEFLKGVVSLENSDCYVYHNEDGEEDEAQEYDIQDKTQANEVRHGASKWVLFYDAFPSIVVKIPIYGDYFEEDDVYSDYENANEYIDIPDGNDYCMAEESIAYVMDFFGLGMTIAHTQFLCNLNGIPFYISEKITHDYDSSIKYSNVNSAALAQNLYETFGYSCPFGKKLLGYFIDSYGEEITNQLINFVCENHIDDFHNGNFGFDDNLHIKIIDYSGFNY